MLVLAQKIRRWWSSGKPTRGVQSQAYRRTILNLEQLEDRCLLAPVIAWVKTGADNGNNLAPLKDSLRAAIISVNKGNANEIEFDIANKANTPVLVRRIALPAFTKQVIINGAATPAGKGNQTITLQPDPAGVPPGNVNGLDFESGSDSSTVFGITVRGFSNGDGILLNNVRLVQIGGPAAGQRVTLIKNKNGVEISGFVGLKDGGNVVGYSYIGTDSTFALKLGNTNAGVLLDKSSRGNKIGSPSTDLSTFNVIANNGTYGVQIVNSTRNTIMGNLIGTDQKGDQLGNAVDGVLVDGLNAPLSSNNTIGGAATVVKGLLAVPANVISDNGRNGVTVNGANNSTTIAGDFIGTDPTGKKALANQNYGIAISGGSLITVGGPFLADANVISGNTKSGINLTNKSTANTLQKNFIGWGSDGKAVLGNGTYGIYFDATSKDNTVQKGNRIANNKEQIKQPNDDANTILDPNSIDEPGPCIDNGSTANDPTLTSATVNGLTTSVQGYLAGADPNATFEIEFFGNDVEDPSGQGPGQVYLGETTVNTDGNGNASFSVTLNAVYGSYTSATATNLAANGGTSEFSQDAVVTGLGSLSAVGGTVWNDANVNGVYDSGESGVSGVAVYLTPPGGGSPLASTTTGANGQYTFTGLNPGSYAIQFVAPTGDSFTAPYQDDPTISSHADPTTGLTETFTLDAGQYDPFLNAGVIPTSSQATTTTTLAADENPSNYGDQVNFTATVTPSNSVTPGGNVTFKDNGTVLGTADLTPDGSNYTAEFSTGSLTVGNHPITATYSGDGFYTGSSGSLTQIVQQAYSFTTLATSGSPALSGQPVTFTATVDGFGDNAPTGTVTFYDGSTQIGSGTLAIVNGVDQATFTTSTLASGPHTITATYGGDANYLTSSSDPLNQVISAGATDSITLNSSNSSATAGQNVTFTAVVSGSQGTPTGLVTFEDDGSVLGTASLDSTGTATYTTAGLELGDQTITAIYGGDATYAGASTSIAQAVTQTSTSLSLSASTSMPQLPTQPITFTATLTYLSTLTPSGDVTFVDGTTELGTGTLAVVNGQDQASFSTTLALGPHTITAAYEGDYNFSGSSAALSEPVNLANAGISLSSSANPSQPNQSVTFTATASVPGGTPTGTVTFYDGTSVLGSSSLAVVNNQDIATYSTSTLASGIDAISAVYGGDSNYAPGSAALSQTVGSSTLGSTTTTASAASNPALPGQSVTLTATVQGFMGTPTGTVTFLDGTTVLGSGTLAVVNNQDQATYTTSTLALGPHAITAVYSGDSTNAPSAGTMSETVQLGSTMTTVSSSANPASAGQAVTYTATVSATGGTPTGTVTFFDGDVSLGSGTLAVVGGQDQATFTTSTLPFGTQPIEAIYGGDSTFAPSTAALSQTVNQVASTTTISSSANPSTLGNAVTFTAIVSGLGGTPTGEVQFQDGTAVLGTASLAVVNGQDEATWSTSALVLGSHAITAIYLGDGTFASSAAALQQAVNQGGMAPLRDQALTTTSGGTSAGTVTTGGQTAVWLPGALGFGGTGTGSGSAGWYRGFDADLSWLATLLADTTQLHALDALFGGLALGGS